MARPIASRFLHSSASIVPHTAGTPGRYTGTYGQVRMDWAINRTWSFAVEAVHFEVADAIRRAGGKNSNYLGVQLGYGW